MTDKEWAKVHSFVLVSETNQGKVVKTMTKREMYEAKTEEFLQPVVDEHGFELVDVEYVKEGSNWYLRAYIDKEGGIAVDDCEVISRILSDWLDKTDFIEDSYILEVSSPGLGRPLKKEKDYKRSVGKLIDIKLYKPVDKCKEFTGVLDSYDKDTVTIKMDDDTQKTFDRSNLAMIRLAFCE